MKENCDFDQSGTTCLEYLVQEYLTSEGAEVQHTDLGLKFNLLYHLSNNCPCVVTVKTKSFTTSRFDVAICLTSQISSRTNVSL